MLRTIGYDGFYSLIWVDGFPAVMRHGVWYPHWLPEGYGGLGTSTFYFYPPLAFVIVTPIRLLAQSVSATAIYHIAGFLMTLGSFCTMYYVLRAIGATPKLILLGALLYAFAPYHFEVLYTRSGLAEHLAFVWAPLVFAGARDIILMPPHRARGFALASISWGLLLLSHVPASATIGVAVLVVSVLSLWKTGWQPVAVLASAMMLGTGLAALYLLPVEHFRAFAQLQYLQVTHAGLEDPSLALLDVIHGNNFTVKSIALVHYGVLVTMMVALMYLWRKRRTENERSSTSDPLVVALMAITIADVFFQTVVISRPIWNVLHFTQIIQFGWRWNLLAALIAAVVYATIDDERVRPWINASVAVLAGTALFFAVLTNLDLRVHPRDAQRTPFDPPEYAPIWADASKEHVIAFALVHEGDAFIADSSGHVIPFGMISHQPNSIHFDINLQCPTSVTFHHWYWPSWKLRMAATGGEIMERPDAEGRATAILPAGAREYRYQLETSAAEKTGDAISIVSLLLIGAGVVMFSRTEWRRVGSLN